MVGNQNDAEQTSRGQEQGESPKLSDDHLYRALSSKRRRRLLYVLLVEESSDIERIATVLSGWEATDTETMVTPEDRERIVIELEHVHVPILEDAGLVAYDRERGAVSLEALDSAVTELISRSVESEPPSSS